MFETIRTFLANRYPATLQISRAALGKYIIGFACLLHVVWAIILMIDIRAVNATPLAIIFALLQHDRIFTIVVLLLVSFLAGAFLDIRLRMRVSMTALSLFLVPQQLILWCSAFNGLYCTFIQQYADGTKISWPHILTDQSPIIFMALLYTVALLESRHPPDFGDSLVGRSTKGEQGIQGIQGIPGPAGVAGVQGEVGPAGATGIGGRGGRGGKGGAGGKGGDAPAELGAPGEQGSVGEQSGNK